MIVIIIMLLKNHHINLIKFNLIKESYIYRGKLEGNPILRNKN